MTKLKAKFEELKKQNQRALIHYWPVGYPTIEESKKYIRKIIEGGADILEIGIPFSDPLADGPTIQKCSQIALKNGVTLEKSLGFIKELRAEGCNTPIVLMGYLNPFMAYGKDKLLKEMQELEIDGLIIPDLPASEDPSWRNSLKAIDKCFIQFLSPNSTVERIEEVTENAEGFIYAIAVTGVTGARTTLSDKLVPFLEKVKSKTDTPVSVGFGISKPEQIQELRPYCEGMIIASKILNLVDSKGYNEGSKLLQEAVQGYKKATLLD